MPVHVYERELEESTMELENGMEEVRRRLEAARAAKIPAPEITEIPKGWLSTLFGRLRGNGSEG